MSGILDYTIGIDIGRQIGIISSNVVGLPFINELQDRCNKESIWQITRPFFVGRDLEFTEPTVEHGEAKQPGTVGINALLTASEPLLGDKANRLTFDLKGNSKTAKVVNAMNHPEDASSHYDPEEQENRAGQMEHALLYASALAVWFIHKFGPHRQWFFL